MEHTAQKVLLNFFSRICDRVRSIGGYSIWKRWTGLDWIVLINFLRTCSRKARFFFSSHHDTHSIVGQDHTGKGQAYWKLGVAQGFMWAGTLRKCRLVLKGRYKRIGWQRRRRDCWCEGNGTLLSSLPAATVMTEGCWSKHIIKKLDLNSTTLLHHSLLLSKLSLTILTPFIITNARDFSPM